MYFRLLAYFFITFTTIVSAEVETVREVRLPQPMLVPRDVITKVSSIGGGVTDLVKQVKRLEAKLNLVLERVIARKRAISKELDGFESGVDSILSLLAPATSEVIEMAGKKTVVVEDDSDGDEVVTTVQDQSGPKTIIVKGDRKRRDSPRRRKRSVEDIETDDILSRLQVYKDELDRIVSAGNHQSSASSPTKIRRKRSAKRKENRHKRDRQNIEARYHISLDNVEPVLIESMGDGWPVRARRRAGSAAVEVVAHAEGAGGDEFRRRRDLDDEEPVPEVELDKRDAAAETTIIEDMESDDDDSAEETIITEERVQPRRGQEVTIIEETSDDESPDASQETDVKETDVVTADGQQTVIEEVERTETADDDDDDGDDGATDDDAAEDDDDDDDDEGGSRLTSEQRDDGGDDASDEDRLGPVMADGSPT